MASARSHIHGASPVGTPGTVCRDVSAALRELLLKELLYTVKQNLTNPPHCVTVKLDGPKQAAASHYLAS